MACHMRLRAEVFISIMHECELCKLSMKKSVQQGRNSDGADQDDGQRCKDRPDRDAAVLVRPLCLSVVGRDSRMKK